MWVKADSVVQLSGYNGYSDSSSEFSRKRLKCIEEGQQTKTGVRKSGNVKSGKTKNIEIKQVTSDEKKKDAQRKHLKKRKLKEVEETGPMAITELNASTQNCLTPVSPPANSTKKPVTLKPNVNKRAGAEHSFSSDSSDNSTEEDVAAKKTALKVPSLPVPSKVSPKAKLPDANLHHKPSSLSKDSHECPTKISSDSLLKKTPLTQLTTPKTCKVGKRDNAPSIAQPGTSALQSSACAQIQMCCFASFPAEKRVEHPGKSDLDTSNVEEVKLVNEKMVQGFLMEQASSLSDPLWAGHSQGKPKFDCRGERGRDRGRERDGAKDRSSSGSGGESSFNSTESQQWKQPSYQSDLSTNCSVVLQAETLPNRNYSDLPLLAAPPQVGQTIAFKLVELTENYTPEVSKYKEGKVVGFDPASKQIELELLHTIQTFVVPGKFDLVYQNPDGSERVEYAVSRDSRVTEHWDSLLEPRLVI
ncbi:coilin isoform X2 [Lampris incognitus]|uniref:coilin isoform X2 n=1 Tax=Lampris incognitus TaxID=2546036 RepID=UPI0024B4A96A|nr:coilin isoform X2 [Lampris incognitus]